MILVPWTESRQMLDKLKDNGIQTWFLMANDEGHGYAKKKNQDSFLFDDSVCAAVSSGPAECDCQNTVIL